MPSHGTSGGWSNRGQDATSRRVLMVAWMDRTALTTTIASGQAHFWSRSQGELWRKGDQRQHHGGRRLGLDCDGDTILMAVSPAGPACHTGSVSCFDSPDRPTPLLARSSSRLQGSWRTGRATSQGSYTVELVDAGVDRVARRCWRRRGWPSSPRIAPPARGSQSSVAEEAADLLYHLLVLLQAREVPASAVAGVLEERSR